MPSARRTRAMGHSPGGPKALDLNAPTRQTRKAKTPAAPKDAPAPATRTTRARAGPKRKNEDLTVEEPPAKKTRRTKSIEEPETIASSSQALITVQDSGSEDVPESTPPPKEEEPAIEAEQVNEPRVNAQQPTPPLDTPVNASPLPHIAKVPQANMQEDNSPADARRQKNEKRISDMMRRYLSRHYEEEEDEKALSECDDEEWAERYSSVMAQAKNPKRFIPKLEGDWEKWAPGSTAMFVVREPKQKDLAARDKSGQCMTPSTLSSGLFTTTCRLAALGARPLTNIDTIVAISASLDWYEKNSSVAAPSAAEVTAMLDDFARAKQSQQAQQSHAPNPVLTEDLQNPTFDAPLAPKAQVINKELPEALSSSESDDNRSNIDDQEELGMEQHGDLIADVEQNGIEPTEPQTPQQQQQQPQASRTWASALSASTIGNVLLTPVNWFTRRDRERQNISATEPRPVRAEPDVTRSAKPHQKVHPRDTPAPASKTLPVKKISSHNLEGSLAHDSPTPTAPQLRRGRPDSHLPVHLRGVLYEDLPSEWQAVSQHLKKPQQDQVEEEDEPVDMEYLLATAKRTRKERDRKELQEQAELIAQKQRALESDDESSADHVDRKGKKRVAFSPQKTYSAKLGHSTFGMPANIDDTSSEEEFEFQGPRTHFGRNSRPMKSCLKRAYQKPTCEDNDGLEGDGGDGYEQRPAKKARFDGFEPSESSEVLEAQIGMASHGEGYDSFLYEDDPHRARPCSRFISKPPSELRAAEAAQREYERLNFRSRSRSPGFHSEIDRMSQYQKNKIDNPNIFTSGGGIHNDAALWHKMFQPRISRYQPSPDYSRRRYGPGSPRDANGRLIKNFAPLMEIRQARLNKQRENALKEKPEISSGLQVVRTLSPVQEKPSSKGVILDDEVMKIIALLDDDEILAEGFGKYPDHTEATISREASKAIEYPTWFERNEEAARATLTAETEGEL